MFCDWTYRFTSELSKINFITHDGYINFWKRVSLEKN